MESTNSVKWLWVAVVVLAVATVGFAIWAFMAQSSANSLSDEKASLQQTLSDEDSSLSSADKSNADLQQQKESLTAQETEIQSKYNEAEKTLTVDKETIQDKEREIDQLNTNLANEQKSAAQDEASLQKKLTAEQTKADLATACASWLVRSMNMIYKSPADANVLREVANTVARTGTKCKDVVS